MSFMYGFGTAFSDSFSQERQRSAKRRDDMFQKTYENFLMRKKEYDELKTEDTKAVNKAKSFVEQYGQPEEAWTRVYSWIQEGFDDNYIAEQLSTGKFSVIQGTDNTPKVSETPVKPHPVSQPEAAALSVGNPNVGMFKRLFKNGPNLAGQTSSYQERIAQDSLSRTSMATGIPINQIQDVMGGYKSPVQAQRGNVQFTPGTPARKPDPFSNLNEAMIEYEQAQTAVERDPSLSNQERFRMADERIQALQRAEFIKANADALSNGIVLPGTQVKVTTPDGKTNFAYATRGPNGEIMIDGAPVDGDTKIQPFGEDEQKEYSKLAGELQPLTDEYNQKLVAMTSVIREAGGMSKLVDDTGGAVLSERVGNLSQYLQGWGAEIVTGMKIIDEAVKSNQPIGQDKGKMIQVENMEQQINDMISSGVNDVGTARALFQAKTRILAYKMASMEGQDGRGLSETEREMFERLAEGGNSPEKFNQNMANIIFTRLNNLQDEANIVNRSNVQQEAFMRRFGWQERPFELAQDPEELISQDEELQAIYDRFKPYNNLSVRPQSVAPRSETQEPPIAAIPSRAIEALRQRPELAEQFNRKYGPGAAERVLGQ